MKDLLRFDTIVASIALLMSCITAGAVVYQTRVLQDEYSASVWPYLSVEEDVDTNYVRIRLVNQGVGPALIRSAQLLLDKKPIDGWNKAFFSRIFSGTVKHGTHMQIGDSSVDSSTAIRAGDSMQIVAMKSSQVAVLQDVTKHDIELNFCYCSINGKCWTLDAARSDAAAIPVAVNGCTEHHSINAPSDILPSAKS